MKYRIIKPKGKRYWKLQVKTGWFTWEDTGATDIDFFEVARLKLVLERGSK